MSISGLACEIESSMLRARHVAFLYCPGGTQVSTVYECVIKHYNTQVCTCV